MQGITKGTLLGGRYELKSEMSDAPGLARWIAQDEKLGREVMVTVFPSQSAHAEAALDSARRAAGVDEQRLVRVLDAGTDGDNSYIIDEAHTGAHSLADLVRFEQMHPEEARRIVGETASALEAARQRGLHHLILDPRHVLRLADGSIVVTQMAVGGALAGKDGLSSSESTKLDTVALVSLLFTALTGLWPGSELGIKGLDRAERRADGQLPTPHELVDGVPGDLDAMCRQTLNHNEGPKTPGEVAKQLAPWSAQMITAPGKPRRSTPLEADSERPPSRDDDGYTMRRSDEGAQAPRKGVGAVGAAALAAASASAGATAASKKSKDATDAGQTSALPRPSAPPAADADRGRHYDADETTTFSLEDEDAAYARSSGYDPSFEELEPPVPGFSSGTDDPDARSSRLALLIVAVFVLLALVLAYFGLQSASGGKSSGASASAPAATSAAGSSAASPSSTASAASSSGTPVQILGTSVVNKYGYRIADSNSAAQASDGDTSTEWQSKHYLNKPWGGFQSYGGLAVKLASSTDVKQIKITPGAGLPLTADVYVSDVPGTSGTKVGSVSNATSEQTINTNASGQYVTIFVTTMTQPAGQTYYQAAIAEVSVSK